MLVYNLALDGVVIMSLKTTFLEHFASLSLSSFLWIHKLSPLPFSVFLPLFTDCFKKDTTLPRNLGKYSFLPF